MKEKLIRSSTWIMLFLVPLLGAAQPKQRTVGIFIFDDVQIIDYTGPYEVFFNANANDLLRFKVFTVSKSRDTITTVGNMDVIPEYQFGQHPKIDVLVLPGGWGVYQQRKDPAVIDWIQKQSEQAEVVLSVCNGAFFLSKAGLLENLSATTTGGSVDQLHAEVPSLKPVYDKRFVDNGKIVTSAGLTAGMDAALHVIEKLLSKGWAQQVALDLEYDWQPNSSYARGLFADRYIPPGWFLYPAYHADPISTTGDTDTWETKSKVYTTQSPQNFHKEISDKLLNHKRQAFKQDESRKATETQSYWKVNSKTNGGDWLLSIKVEAGLNQTLLLTVQVVNPESGKSFH